MGGRHLLMMETSAELSTKTIDHDGGINEGASNMNVSTVHAMLGGCIIIIIMASDQLRFSMLRERHIRGGGAGASLACCRTHPHDNCQCSSIGYSGLACPTYILHFC